MKHVCHLTKSLPVSITVSYCCLFWASSSIRSDFCNHVQSQTIWREQCLVIPLFFFFGGGNPSNKKRAKLSMHREPVLPLKQSKACAHRGIFSMHPAYFTPKNALFLQPLIHTSSRKRISTFSPQLALCPGQLKGLFKHCQANEKTLRRRGKSCGGLNKLCIFIAQTHRPMLILLNHMHTLARRLLRTFSGTRSEWL